MRISDIAQLKQQSEALREALKTHDAALWQFLREKVQTREGCFPQGHHGCEQCGKVAQPWTLKSPYNTPHPGWCIDCVLHAYFTGAPYYLTPEQQREQDLWGSPSDGVEWA